MKAQSPFRSELAAPAAWPWVRCAAWAALLLNAVVAEAPAQLLPLLKAATDITATPDVPPENGTVAVTDTGLLDIHIRDVSLAVLLETLSYEARLNIVTTTSVNGQVSANLYDVTLEQALDALLTPSQYTYRKAGGTIFVGTPEELTALAPPPVTRLFRLRYTPAAEASAAVKAILGENAAVVKTETAAGASGSSGTGTTSAALMSASMDYLIVTAPVDVMPQVEALLADLDERPRQVLIEATILRATLDEQNQFGVDFTMLGGVDFENVSSVSLASSNITPGLLPQDRLQQTTFNARTDFAGNVTAGGFSFGLIKDSIASFIRALEEVTDVVVVANPKIVALNRQEGEVIVGRRDGYLTTTVTETAAIQKVEFLETGTQIRFRPHINEDGTVRLSVHPKDSNGGLTAANLPFEETTEAHADLLVDDGNTILIGGLFRERTLSSRSQIPLVGDIPIFGELFGSRSDSTIREEVIILLTVHVLKETPEEQMEFRALLEDVERVRVGSRQGLFGTGRERLAQAFYHEALKQLDEGDLEAALLNTRMALHNQPKHIAALKLKEELLDRRLWDDEGSRMRTFIWTLLDEPQPVAPLLPEPVFGRPPVIVREPAEPHTVPAKEAQP